VGKKSQEPALREKSRRLKTNKGRGKGKGEIFSSGKMQKKFEHGRYAEELDVNVLRKCSYRWTKECLKLKDGGYSVCRKQEADIHGRSDLVYYD